MSTEQNKQNQLTQKQLSEFWTHGIWAWHVQVVRVFDHSLELKEHENTLLSAHLDL